jgi:TetR/AcrR family transcriptional repressor of lmrAB and yxaGH operons
MGRAAKHRQNLVRTAMRLFRRQGYASTGLQQIVDESGAPKGSLYHYFPDGKESIAEAAVELAGGLLREKLEELAAKHADPKAFVSAWCKVMAGWMEEADFQSGSPITTVLLETAPRSRAITAAGQRAIDGWIEVVAGVLQRGGAAATRSEARKRGEMLVAAMEGALILARVRRSKAPILEVAKWV